MAIAKKDSEISKTQYEVFLSFRGRDTRQGFTDVFYDHLKESGIKVFRDDDELAIGDNIDLILEALENSKICVPIFSKSFASSAWCLREVAKMVELNKDIVPVFYDVTPDDVKLKTSLYLDQLMEQHHKKSEIKQEWEGALMVVGRIKGRELKETGFVEFSKQLRKEILLKLRLHQKYTINNFVEMTDQTQLALNLLNIESADHVGFLGIHGMGGVGKSTLAKTIFNRIASNFDGCSFLSDIREEMSRKGFEKLHKKLFKDLNPKACDVVDWEERMKQPLHKKRLLIVLDDVGERNQIVKLVGDCSFGLGSRIIITTRDERVLLNIGIATTSGESDTNNEEEDLPKNIQAMQMEGMNSEQALGLFSRHAFGSEYPPQDYISLSNDVVTISSGLPLALEVIGSLLCGMSVEAWKDKISKLKKIPAKQVREKLMVSYEALEDDAKEIFLDIACFFINEEKSNVIYMWEACGFCPNWTVPVLQAMSLVKIKEDGTFWMHDQLRDLGREIVRTKGLNNPSSKEGSRIQTYEDAFHALDSNKGKEAVGLHLDGIGNTPTDLTSYENLRFLRVQRAMSIDNFWQLPKNLRWLSLSFNKPNSIASIRRLFSSSIPIRNTSYLMKLVVLDLSYSRITDGWEGWILIQELQSLKFLDLTWCYKLTRTPNFSKMVALEKLILRNCGYLAKIDSSIKKLHKLKYLNLEHCFSLHKLPEEVGNLEDLEQMIIKDTCISNMPNSIGELKNLNRLSLTECKKLRTLPQSIGDLRSLVHLDISASSKLKELPATIGQLVKLEHLSLSKCGCMNKLPESVGDLTSLISLDLSECRLMEEFPSSITKLVKLQTLSLLRCEKIVQLPDDFGKLESLVKLNLSGTGVTVVPDSIRNLVRLKAIDLSESKVNVLPETIGDLESLQVMNLSQTKVSILPDTIAQLSRLQTLDLSRCHHIERFPKLPASLTHLRLQLCKSLRQSLDVSELVHLKTLFLDDQEREVTLLPPRPHQGVEPFEFRAIWELPRLLNLDLKLESLTCIPVAGFIALTQLKSLWLKCPNLKCVPQFPSSIQSLTLEGVGEETKLPCLSNLINLSELVFRNCWSEGGIHRFGVERLESVTRLGVFECGRLVTFPDLSSMKSIEQLEVMGCKELVEIPGLGRLRSLKQVRIGGCGSLKRLENIKNLERLKRISITDCKKFQGIQGIEKFALSYTFRAQVCKCRCKDLYL